MTRPIAQHLANNPGIAQHLANNLGGDAPMRLHHKVHMLQHGAHGGWLTFVLFLLIIGLPFIIALAGMIYRRTQRGSAQSASAYRPVAVAPWQSSANSQPAGAPWQSGMSNLTVQPSVSAPWSAAPTGPAWSAPNAGRWQAPAARSPH